MSSLEALRFLHGHVWETYMGKLAIFFAFFIIQFHGLLLFVQFTEKLLVLCFKKKGEKKEKNYGVTCYVGHLDDV